MAQHRGFRRTPYPVHRFAKHEREDAYLVRSTLALPYAHMRH
jgi:hypothetical protein